MIGKRSRRLGDLPHFGEQGPGADRLELNIGVVQQAIEFVDLTGVVGLRHAGAPRACTRSLAPGSWQIDVRIGRQ